MLGILEESSMFLFGWEKTLTVSRPTRPHIHHDGLTRLFAWYMCAPAVEHRNATHAAFRSFGARRGATKIWLRYIPHAKLLAHAHKYHAARVHRRYSRARSQPIEIE